MCRTGRRRKRAAVLAPAIRDRGARGIPGRLVSVGAACHEDGNDGRSKSGAAESSLVLWHGWFVDAGDSLAGGGSHGAPAGWGAAVGPGAPSIAGAAVPPQFRYRGSASK